MKTFLEYLYESAQLNENSTQYLLSTYDLAVKYFKQTGSLKDTGITLQQIKQIYDYAESHKKQLKQKYEPIVADYEGRNGYFAFRRWVEDVIGNVKKNKAFRGFHDTSLKAGTQKGSWTPSPQDMESLICLAFNASNGLLDSAEQKQLITASEMYEQVKAGKLNEDEIANSDKAKLYYKQHQEQLDMIASVITDFIGHPTKTKTLDKLANSEQATDEWKESGNFGAKKPNNTPKTDIITADSQYKISLKKGDEGAQLMSAAQNETFATILTVCSRIRQTPAIQKLQEIVSDPDFKFEKIKTSDIKSMNSAEFKNRKIAAKKNVEKLEALLKQQFVENHEFAFELAKEAASGNIKFGEDADSAANCVLVWSIDKPQLNRMFSMDEYIEKIIHKVKIQIGFKTSPSSGTFQSLRLITPPVK